MSAATLRGRPRLHGWLFRLCCLLPFLLPLFPGVRAQDPEILLAHFQFNSTFSGRPEYQHPACFNQTAVRGGNGPGGFIAGFLSTRQAWAAMVDLYDVMEVVNQGKGFYVTIGPRQGYTLEVTEVDYSAAGNGPMYGNRYTWVEMVICNSVNITPLDGVPASCIAESYQISIYPHPLQTVYPTYTTYVGYTPYIVPPADSRKNQTFLLRWAGAMAKRVGPGLTQQAGST